MFDASLSFDPQQQRVVIALGLVLCAGALALLTRRQIAVSEHGERSKLSRARVLVTILLAAFWVVVGVQLLVMVR